jgi:hypothetical protein
MKNKLRKLLRFGLTSFAIGLLLTNCEKDSAREETISVEEQEPTLTLKHYSKTNIEKNTKLVSRLKEFNDELIKNKSAKQSGKNVYNKEYDFTIYTDSATYIQNGDYHSYTFPIIQGADDKITNVMFELNDQNEYDAYLVNYDYSANEFKYKDFKSLSMKTSIKPLNLAFSSLFSKTKTAYVCVYSYEYVRTGSHFTNGDSNLIEFDYGWVLTAGYCETVLYYDEDYKEYHEGNTATITIGGTTYGGTGGSITSPTPSPFDSEELIKIDIVKNRLGLNHPERLWIDKWENGQYAFQLYDFLVKNLYTQEAIDFSKSAFVAFYNNNGEVDFDEKIINTLTGKALCIYNKLKSSSSCFANAIKKFDGDFPVSHLKFEIDPNESSNTRKAYTTPPSNYMISIVLNGNAIKDASYQKRPNLMVAKTIIHEVIHAEMWRKILSIIDNGGNIQGTTRQQWVDKLSNGDYPGIFDFYTRFGANGFQHPQMAANYRNVIADALASFDNNANPRQFYDDLAWEGLIYQNDPTWGSLSSSEKTRIQNTINNYFNQNKNESCNE